MEVEQIIEIVVIPGIIVLLHLVSTMVNFMKDSRQLIALLHIIFMMSQAMFGSGQVVSLMIQATEHYEEDVGLISTLTFNN